MFYHDALTGGDSSLFEEARLSPLQTFLLKNPNRPFDFWSEWLSENFEWYEEPSFVLNRLLLYKEEYGLGWMNASLAVYVSGIQALRFNEHLVC